MYLDRAVDHVVQDLGAKELDQGDLLARGRSALGVDHPGRVQRHQARGRHLGRRIGYPVLHRFVARKLLAECLALQCALAEHVEGAPRLAEPAHAMVNAARSQPGLRDEETLTSLADEVLLRHAHVLIEDLGVAVAEALVSPHRWNVAQLLEARRVTRDDDHRRPLVRTGVGVGDDHRDQEVRDHAVRCEPFVSVDHPFVALELGGGGEEGRVGARGIGLGHREGRAHLAVEQRVQPALLLLVGSKVGEDLGVA